MYLINSFFIYSTLGYIMEITFAVISGANNPESGVLYGPWTPIYGIASILIILISEKLFKKLHMKRWKETIIVFFLTIPILMLLEWLGGTLIEIIFGFSFWDYTDYKLNLGKYTCLEFGIIWGLMSIIFIYIIRPYIDKFIKKIPFWVTITISFLMLVDLIIRLLKEFNII